MIASELISKYMKIILFKASFSLPISHVLKLSLLLTDHRARETYTTDVLSCKIKDLKPSEARFYITFNVISEYIHYCLLFCNVEHNYYGHRYELLWFRFKR